MRVWIGNTHQRLVAVDAGKIVGAAAADEKGEIILNYVSPDARFTGASKALMDGARKLLRDKGHASVSLASTQDRASILSEARLSDDGAPACHAGGVTCRDAQESERLTGRLCADLGAAF